MIKKIILVITVSAISALTVFGQYFSRVYYDDLRNGRGYSAFPINNDEFIFTKGIYFDTLNREVANITKHNKVGDITKDINLNYWLFIANSGTVRNDTFFYSGKDFQLQNNKFHWYIGMLDKDANQLVEYKYEMPLAFGQYPNSYDIDLVKNNEMIIWGNGYDPYNENSQKDLGLVWLRVKLDGTLISGPNYYKPPIDEWGSVTNAKTDIDGNMVCVYETRQRNNQGGYDDFRILYKLYEDDTVKEIGRIDHDIYDDGHAFLGVGHDSSYLVHTGDDRRESQKTPRFIKMDKNGDVLWDTTFQIFYSVYSEWGENYNIQKPTVSSISRAKNNDFIITGYNFAVDSFYINKLGKKIASAAFSSYIVRIAPDGKIVWRRAFVSLRDDGEAMNVTANSIEEMEDGSLIIGGSLESKISTTYKAFPWVLKVGPNGCFDPECSNVPNDRWWYFPDEIPTSATDLVTYEKLSLYPNPGVDKINISLPDGITYPIQYQITTMSGQTVETGVQQEQSFSLDAGFLSAGTYIVLCKDKSGKVLYSKWVKM